MPATTFTHDKRIVQNNFDSYPDWNLKFLAPLMGEELDLPCRLKLTLPPQAQHEHKSSFPLFENAHGHCLGAFLKCGHWVVLILPRFKSNESAIYTFLHRVVPKMYDMEHKASLIDVFHSPAEREHLEQLHHLEQISAQIAKDQETARADLQTARRAKAATIRADATAKQVLMYYDQARRDDNAALFYLYKIVEAIENRFGGETAGIKAVGAGTSWKAVKRLANESYRDARHAPKPTDVTKPWSPAEIKQAFTDTETVIMAYFATLFLAAPAE